MLKIKTSVTKILLILVLTVSALFLVKQSVNAGGYCSGTYKCYGSDYCRGSYDLRYCYGTTQYSCLHPTCDACVASSCVWNACGATRQACCPGGVCDPWNYCVSATNKCYACGDLNAYCCPGSQCKSGYTCVGGYCRIACGGANQPCCTNNTCNPTATQVYTCINNVCRVNECQYPIDSNYPATSGKYANLGDTKCQIGLDGFPDLYTCVFINNKLVWEYTHDCLYSCQDQQLCSVESGYCEQVGCCSPGSVNNPICSVGDSGCIWAYFLCWSDAAKATYRGTRCGDLWRDCNPADWGGCVGAPLCDPNNPTSCQSFGNDWSCTKIGRDNYCCPGNCVSFDHECVYYPWFDCDSREWGYPGRYEYQDNCGTLMCLTEPCAGVCNPPAAPVLSPADGERLHITEGQTVTLSWSTPTNADTFEMWLYPLGKDCTDESAVCQEMGASTTYSFTPLESDYHYQVRGFNADCPEIPGAWGMADFNVMGLIEGTVRRAKADEVSIVGGICTLPSAPGIRPNLNTKVDAPGVPDSGAVNGPGAGEGTYKLNNVPVGGGGLIQLILGDPLNWICTCPEGCAYGGIKAPKSNLDFFVSDQRDAWFQVESGCLHADNGNISTKIPPGATKPYLITGVSGLPSYTGVLSLGADFGVEAINESGSQWRAKTKYEALKTDYGYFNRLLEDDPSPKTDWSGGAFGASGVYKASGDVNMEGRTIASGNTYVALVDGTVTITGNITVAQGGFLAVIASGDITVNDSVLAVQGVYVADGIFKSGSGAETEQFVGQGIFVGWGGMSLKRSLGGRANNQNPAERYIWRPDLQVNAYSYLKKPHFTWKEVAP
jgi:hypothetical protein